MGRADRAAGSNSDRCSERSRKIGQVRTKRKKRKRDLEELHRNVLKAKHNARLRANQPKIKRRTNFAKVLGNFADKRRDNEVEDEVLENGEPRRKKPKKICERLLPVPMVGIYQNGAKGREIRRAVGHLNETGVARLQGNVLKLLKGDETSAKSSRERNDREVEEKEKKKNKGGNPDRPSDDDSNDSEKSQNKNVQCSLVEDHSMLRKTKGPKRTSPDEMKLPEVREQTRKDEANELSRQRDEAKCRRRLFEPDEDAIAKNRFGLIDRTMMTNHEIRTKNTFEETKNYADDREGRMMEKNEKYRREGDAVSRPDAVVDKFVSNDNFWGWSPVTCYERLCAMISIDNFENKSHRRHRLPDPVVKIQKILRGLFTHNGRRMRERATKLLVNSTETKENTNTWESMGTSNEEEGEEEEETIEEEVTIQACTQDESDMEQCSSLESSITMIGSWHQKNVQRYRSNDDSSGVFETKIKATARFKRSRKNEMAKMDVETPIKEDERWKDFSSSVVTETTNDSVFDFLEKFKYHNSLNNKERPIFRMEIDGNRRASEDGEDKLKICLKTPPCGKKSADNPRCGLRRNTMKHVPTILRRSNEHMGHVGETIHEKNSRGIHLPNVERPAENINSLPDDNTSSFFSLRHFPTPTKDIRSIEERAIFPRPDAMLGESNYYRRGTTIRESGQQARHEHKQFGPAHLLKSKLAPMRAEHQPNSKMLSNQDPRAESWRESNYDANQRDRGIETTNVHTFATESSGKNCTCENLFLPEDQPRLVDFPTDPADHGSNVAGFARDRVRFLDEQFFNADDDGVRNGRPGGNFEVRKNDHDSGAKAHKILTNRPRKAQQDNPRGCERFSSFEFTRPQIEPYSQRFNDPKDITGKKLTARDPEAPKLTVFRGRNTTEPSVNGGLANKPSFPCPSGKRLETGTFRCVKTEYKMSEKPNLTQSELESLENLQETFENPFPIEKMNPSLVKQHRGIIGKPVVLFRPIEASRQKRTKHPQISDSRNHDNSESIAMREALTNLRVMAFDDTTIRHCSRELDHSEFHHAEQPVPPSECERPSIRDLPDQLNLRSFDAWTQPAKFRAYECDEQGNPRRIPIYENFNVTDASGRSETENDASSFLTIVDDKVNVNGTVYVRSNETARPGRKQALKFLQQLPTGANTNQNYLCNNDSNIILRSMSDVTAKEQQQQCSRRVALMVPHFASPHGPQRSNLVSSTLKSTTGPKPTNNAIPVDRILYNATDRQGLSRTPQSRTVQAPIAITRDQRYDSGHQFEGRDSQVTTGTATERIRLSDGRIGILLTDNSTIGNHPRRLNFNPGPSSDMFTRQPDPSVEAGYVYKLATDDGAIYSQPDYQWNTVRESLRSFRAGLSTHAK